MPYLVIKIRKKNPKENLELREYRAKVNNHIIWKN